MAPPPTWKDAAEIIGIAILAMLGLFFATLLVAVLISCAWQGIKKCAERRRAKLQDEEASRPDDNGDEEAGRRAGDDAAAAAGTTPSSFKLFGTRKPRDPVVRPTADSGGGGRKSKRKDHGSSNFGATLPILAMSSADGGFSTVDCSSGGGDCSSGHCS